MILKPLTKTLLVGLLWNICCCASTEKPIDLNNLDFEFANAANLPESWSIKRAANFVYSCDSTTAFHGHRSLKISGLDGGKNFGGCQQAFEAPENGNQAILSAYIKTKNVSNGGAQLWLRIEGEKGDILFFENMHNRPVTGNTNWTKVSINAPYPTSKAKKIVFGALVAGTGTVWVDNVNISVDGKSLNQSKALSLETKPSSCSDLTISTADFKTLEKIGKAWGFLKYYHPAVKSGRYDWDSALFRLIPEILSLKNNMAQDQALATWIESLGPVEKCENCSIVDAHRIAAQPFYNDLFSTKIFSSQVVNKLAFIRDNRRFEDPSFYVAFVRGINNPLFTNEKNYSFKGCPDVGYRLLALFRYWNAVNYYYPHRYLIKDWDKKLADYLPEFIHADTREKYTMACLKLIAEIEDTHAVLEDLGETMDSIKGTYTLPYKLSFIDSGLVVVKQIDSGMADHLQPGDIIQKIDGTDISDLVKKYMPYVAASNLSQKYAQLASPDGFISRGRQAQAVIELVRNNQRLHVKVNKWPLSEFYRETFAATNNLPGFKLLNKNIGYILPSRLKENDLDTIKKLFSDTRGIIIDLRCYPSVFMPFSYGQWLKTEPSPFALITQPSVRLPGAFEFIDQIENGPGKNSTSQGYLGDSHYTGKVVIIVNEETQSQAEYTAMALASRPNCVTIGSQTSGADGNVSTIQLPGQLMTFISGLGIYYPDTTLAQRTGVKIDYKIYPTVQGIKDGRDELLGKAIEMIQH